MGFFGKRAKDPSIPETPGAHYVRQTDEEQANNYSGLAMGNLPVATPIEAQVVAVEPLYGGKKSPKRKSGKGGYHDQGDGSAAASHEPTNMFQKVWRKERRLLVAILVLVLLLLIEWGRYLLYPFLLFATWTHETCHGFAAILVGGTIKKIHIYNDGGGICWYNGIGDNKFARAFVSSAGFCGTAIVGGFLLIFRRMKKGVKIGTIVIGILIIASDIFWIRNKFGFWVMLAIGVVILLAGILVKKGLGTMYAFLAATCCMNAIIDCHSLKNSSDVVNGDEEMESDASQVAEYLGGSYKLWSILWLIQAVVMLILGLVLAFDADEREYYDYT